MPGLLLRFQIDVAVHLAAVQRIHGQNPAVLVAKAITTEHHIGQAVKQVILRHIAALEIELYQQQQPDLVQHIRVHLHLTETQEVLTEVQVAHQVAAIEVLVVVVVPEVQVVAQGVFPEAALLEVQVAHPEAQEEAVRDLAVEEDKPHLKLIDKHVAVSHVIRFL
jgi:hypothetical protein